MPGTGIMLASLLIAFFVTAGCSSSEPTPAPGPTIAQTATVAPTLEPTPTQTARVTDIELRVLSCVDFHPGVLVQEGPNHWYNISGAFFNNGPLSARVQMELEILDSGGSSLFQVFDKESAVESGQSAVFYERIDLGVQANNFRCRVTFRVDGDPAGAEDSVVADVESIYAP